MDKRFVIVTGGPGSGKSSFARKIAERFPSFSLYPYDELKEVFFDTYGFDSLLERTRLNDLSLASYYDQLDDMMDRGGDILIEYPFCKKHEASLQKLVSRHNYKAVTILLHGDAKVLYERWKRRNAQDESRHGGHLYTKYHKGVTLDAANLIPPMSYDEFVASFEKKDYRIHVGTFLSVDVTDFSAIDWESIFARIAPSS